MKFRPLGKRLVIKPIPTSNVTAGGIIIPEGVSERFAKGEVTEAGKECDNVTKGQRILFAREAGLDMEIEGEKYIVLSEENVMLILEEETA